ncbi:MAG: shikimate kinase [Porcipelethomonas sp.]
MAVFLCGFMGCGKSTIAAVLAKYMGSQHCDTDTLIVEREGMSIPEIFEKKGEEYFRSAESRLVEELSGYKGVAACGGGTMLNEKNAETARKNGVVVFINVPFEVCYQRIAGDSNRPVAASKTKEELKKLYDERYEKYLRNSDYCIDAEGSPMEIAKFILKTISLK